jgi:hypothetical protein
MREDQVASLGLVVAGKQDFIDTAAEGLPSMKEGESPASRRGVWPKTLLFSADAT